MKMSSSRKTQPIYFVIEQVLPDRIRIISGSKNGFFCKLFPTFGTQWNKTERVKQAKKNF